MLGNRAARPGKIRHELRHGNTALGFAGWCFWVASASALRLITAMTAENGTCWSDGHLHVEFRDRCPPGGMDVVRRPASIQHLWPQESVGPMTFRLDQENAQAATCLADVQQQSVVRLAFRLLIHPNPVTKYDMAMASRIHPVPPDAHPCQ